MEEESVKVEVQIVTEEQMRRKDDGSFDSINKTLISDDFIDQPKE